MTTPTCCSFYANAGVIPRRGCEQGKRCPARIAAEDCEAAVSAARGIYLHLRTEDGFERVDTPPVSPESTLTALDYVLCVLAVFFIGGSVGWLVWHLSPIVQALWAAMP